MQPSSCRIQAEPVDDGPEVLYEFTPEQVKALEATRARLNFTPEEVEERHRKAQAKIEWIAAATTMEEQHRRGDRVWAEDVERPRAARRIQTARRKAPAPPVQRPRALALAAPRERREASSSRTSGQDPGDDDEPSDQSPFDRPLDRLLEGLRRHCGPDAYRLDPGSGDQPDAWLARCPMHPDAGFTLVLTERGELWCRVGCPPSAIRRVLVPDPAWEELVAERAKVLLWAQGWEWRAA